MAIASFSLPFTYLQKPSSCRCRCSSSSSSSFEKPIFVHSSNGIANKALQEIRNSGVIACLRAQNADLANRAARAALDGGISALEIVVSTPDVFEVIRDLVHDYPAKTFGVGTVLQAKDAKDSIKAGAKFLMSPATVMDILVGVSESDILYIPGVMTPTEILSAFSAGAKIVKVYPVSALGGVGYISALKKPFSHIPMVASQGITIDLIGQYIGQGASAVVLSDAIFDKEAMSQQNFDKIYQLASHSALQGVHEKREIRLSHPSSCFKFGKINCAGSSKGELYTFSEPQSESRLVGAVDFGYQMVSPKTKAVLVSSYVTDLQSVATCCVYVAKGADMPDYKQLQQQLASVRKKIATLNLFAESEKKEIVNEILVSTEPLLTDEDYNVRIIGREIISDLIKAAGIDAMIHVTRLNIDSPNEHIRNAAARSLSIAASALGIPALLPFLEEICFQMESWEARHTGVMIVYHITVLIGSANLLPYLSYLMEIIEPRLKDDIEKIRDVTNVAMDGLATAATLWY